MALTRTTLAAAVADANDTSISVSSATSFAANALVRIDDEWMVVQSNYVSGTSIPVRRGQLGSKGEPHKVTAGVTVGTPQSDWSGQGKSVYANNPIAGRARYIKSRTATESFTDFVPGSDTTLILNGTVVANITIAAPGADQEGDELNVVSNGVAAHTIIFTGGLSGAGAGYTTITINATKPAAFKFIAVNKLWFAYSAPPMGGTVTNIIGSLA
jgi:hypothetical protein